MGDGIVLLDQAQYEAQAMRRGERLHRASQSLIAQPQAEPEAVIAYLGWIGSHECLNPILTLWRGGFLTPATLNLVLAEWWTSASYPSEVSASTVIRLFSDADFISDRAGTARPPAPLVMYRGGSIGAPRGVCWTTDPAIARFFAYRFGTTGRPIFSATVPPHGVLGIFFGRNESEVVVNPRTLRGLRAQHEEAA